MRRRAQTDNQRRTSGGPTGKKERRAPARRFGPCGAETIPGPRDPPHRGAKTAQRGRRGLLNAIFANRFPGLPLPLPRLGHCIRWPTEPCRRRTAGDGTRAEARQPVPGTTLHEQTQGRGPGAAERRVGAGSAYRLNAGGGRPRHGADPRPHRGGPAPPRPEPPPAPSPVGGVPTMGLVGFFLAGTRERRDPRGELAAERP